MEALIYESIHVDVRHVISEHIPTYLPRNIRTSGDIKYLTGDSVYYKRVNSNEWHGPARVLGQDGQQVLVPFGSPYI